jgi:hypothetical protein
MMSKKQILIPFAASIILIAGVGFFEFQRNATPTIRSDIKTPLYTVGEIAGYDQALSDGRTVVKFGPMFAGLYPGGLGFSSVEAAFSYLSREGWDPDLWAVYELSGDYDLDVSDGYVNKTLIVKPKTQGIRIGQTDTQDAGPDLLSFGPVGIGRQDILSHEFVEDGENGHSVRLNLSDDVARDLANFTKGAIGQDMEIKLQGRLLRVTNVAGEISGGKVQLFLSTRDAEILKSALSN